MNQKQSTHPQSPPNNTDSGLPRPVETAATIIITIIVLAIAISQMAWIISNWIVN